MVRNAELWGLLFFFALACGESKKSGGDDESGGSSPGGTSSAGTSPGGTASGSGGATSGGTTTGGASGTTTGGTTTGGTTTGGTTSGGTTSAGTTSGGASGSGAVSGNAGSGGWSATCGDVTHNGRCVGNVYQWCDYFERGIREMDCGARGMTCRADAIIDGEEDSNGCYEEGACTEADQGCDGQVALRCRSGGLQALDCPKNKGALSQCVEATAEIPYPRCGRDTPCGGRGTQCDGNMLLICDEDGRVYLQNCAQRALNGQCLDGGDPYCDPPMTGG